MKGIFFQPIVTNGRPLLRKKMAPTVKRYKYEKRLCDGRVSPKIEAFLSRLQERQKEKREFCGFFNSLRLASDLCALDA